MNILPVLRSACPASWLNYYFIKRTMRTEGATYPFNSLPAGRLQKDSLSERTRSENAFNSIPEILILTSYPPRECGIATYSQDLIKALNNKFRHSFLLSICALESANEKHDYPEGIKYLLNTDHPGEFSRLATAVNDDEAIRIVVIQHEFGFYKNNKEEFSSFLRALTKPVVMAF